jgi:hypothetical protein
MASKLGIIDFKRKLDNARYPLPYPKDGQLYRYEDSVLSAVADQLVQANTRPEQPWAWIIYSLDKKVQDLLQESHNTPYVSEIGDKDDAESVLNQVEESVPSLKPRQRRIKPIIQSWIKDGILIEADEAARMLNTSKSHVYALKSEYPHVRQGKYIWYIKESLLNA